jgi:fimbrial isopeptide formation D2 family protein/uncharacterized repeat protein (TIGR01451 family)
VSPRQKELTATRWGGLRRVVAGVALTALAVGGLSAISLATPPAADAAPGNPGTPSAPTTVYTEDFQNVADITPIQRLTDYTGATGQKYTANQAWLQNCNGWIAAYAQNNAAPAQVADCTGAGASAAAGRDAWNKSQQLAWAIGQANGLARPDYNFADTAFTAGNPGAGLVEFQTATNIPFTAANRFVSFSADVAAINCNVAVPLLQFQLLNDAGTATNAGSQVNGCANGRAISVPATGPTPAGTVNVTNATSNGAVLFNGSSVGIRMVNNQGSGTGNDHTIDNIRILDVTPQLDKAFSPTSIRTGGTSTLTFTVTNTSELGAKNGWSFTDNLPAGLTVANSTVGGTCAATKTATAGATSIAITDGQLNANQASCTITVQVTGNKAGSYTNGPDNVTTVGLNPPGDTTLTITDPPVWTCSANGYLFQSPNAGGHQIYQVDLVSGAATQIGSTADNVNAVGYNTLDNYVYGWDVDTATIVRVAADGSLTNLGRPAGLPASPGFQVGDFDDAGHLFLQRGGTLDGSWVEIDLAPGSSTYGQVVDSGSVTKPAGIGVLPSDWVFVDGAFYGIGNNTSSTGAGRLIRFDATTHSYQDLGALPNTSSASTYGAGYADAAGNLYFSDNGSGAIFRVDPTNRTALRISTGPASAGNDGARCATAPIPTITVTKTVDGRDVPQDQFTVGLRNSGNTVLTSATTTGTNTTASTTDWPVSQGATYTITDAMAAGSGSPLSRYDASVVCTDADGNTVSTGGSTGAWTLRVADATYYTCNVTNAALEDPKLTVTKTADTTDLPQPGDTVTYTVTAKNTSSQPFTAAAPARVSDDMSEVLDDAELDEGSLAATIDGDAVADPTFTSPNLTWSGPLGAGKSVVLTYTVTYNGEGDHVMTNNACVPEADTTEGADSCVSVRIPAPAIDDWKTVERNGSILTYTLHFQNKGAATGPVNKVDNLTGVLDDATVTTEPETATGPLTATRDDNIIRITGNLPAGQTSTITYTVTFKPVDERGDNEAKNFLLDPNTPPPSTCTPTDEQRPDCTVTPLPALQVSKSVDPKSGTTVTAGQVLTYTLTFDNSTGKADAPVTGWKDDLSKVLDDAAVTTQPASGMDSLDVSDIENRAFTVGGTVPAGEAGTVTYKVTVKADGARGDNNLGNALSDGGPCAPGLCTENPVPEVVSSKTVDPKSGTEVTPGQVLTYTLTFTNKGKAAGDVDKTDDLTKVVDDATVTKQPTVSDKALESTKVADGYQITGTLAAGQTVKVTYQVTVKADGQRGDSQLGNFLVNTGDEPVCNEDRTNCTENPVTSIVDWKTVDPATTTDVVPGQVLTYTLHFKNNGGKAGTVKKDDDITHAIDDATVTKQPTVQGGNLKATTFGTDNRAHVTGSLPAGATATVTYQLTVKAAGKLGDGIAANFLLNSNEEPPKSPVCKPTSEQFPDCTVNPIGALKVTKIVDPNTGTTVHPGDTLHYTLSFENVGAGTAKVNHVDDMTGVLDDADVTSQPVASNKALTLSKITDAKLTITGTLAAKQKVIVTYAVTTKPFAQQGDHVMENYLDPVGTPPAPKCVSTDPTCTSNPIAAPPAGLAFTGTELVGPGIGLALMLLALGGGLLVVRRRRNTGDVQENA